jgi:adenosylcobinamide-phosphate synthase
MSLDAHVVARAAIESLAENFSDAVVAPVFWYLLLGLPGLFAYKMANTLDSMIGHRTPRYRSFGSAAARFDDAINLAPARISGLLLTAAAVFVKNGRPDRAGTSDIARALHLYRLACLIEGGLLLGAWLTAHLTSLA